MGINDATTTTSYANATTTSIRIYDVNDPTNSRKLITTSPSLVGSGKPNLLGIL